MRARDNSYITLVFGLIVIVTLLVGAIIGGASWQSPGGHWSAYIFIETIADMHYGRGLHFCKNSWTNLVCLGQKS